MYKAFSDLKQSVLANFLEEKDRYALWLPVFFGFGISLYLALPVEPSPYVSLGLVLFSVVTLIALRHRPAPFVVFLYVFLFCLGFSYAHVRAEYAAAPKLTRTKKYSVTGTVKEATFPASFQRVLLTKVKIQGLDSKKTPEQIKIRLNGYANDWRPGDRIRVFANLGPPTFPPYPGGYNMPRRDWFEGTGGSGYALGKPKEIMRAPVSSLSIQHLRRTIGEKISDAISDKEQRAVARALVIGDQSSISERTKNAYRDSGIAHMLSVSGFHMSLIAGFVFVLRLVFLLFPAFSLKHDPKKICAGLALAVTFLYLLISGAAIPSIRSFIMTGLVLCAILFDRQALSMRTIICAGIFILILYPQSVLSPSFQMSFGAVLALIAAYEAGAGRIRRMIRAGKKPSLYFIIAAWVIGLLVTDFVATVATSPFVLYHFGRLAVFSVLGNMLAAPVISFLVMPALMIGCFLIPFGWEGIFFRAAEQGLILIQKTSAWTASLEGSILLVPSMPSWGFFLAVLGGLWICLWSKKWRHLGYVPFFIGLLSPVVYTTPDLMIADQAALLAVNDGKGHLILEPGRKGKYFRNAFYSMNAEAHPENKDKWRLKKDSNVFSKDGLKTDVSSFSCDGGVCLYEKADIKTVIVLDKEALWDACNEPRADILISRYYLPKDDKSCKVPLKIGLKDLYRDGTHAFWIDKDGRVTLKTSREEIGERIWNR